MNDRFAELLDALQDIQNLSTGLLEASKRKTAALRTMDLKGIQQANEEEERLAEEIAKRDRVRVALVADITGEKPKRKNGYDPVMDRVATLMEVEDRQRLHGLRDEMAAVMKQIQLVNITNSIVSRRSLRHFRELIGVITGNDARDNTYTRRGRMSEDRAPRGLVDHIA